MLVATLRCVILIIMKKLYTLIPIALLVIGSSAGFFWLNKQIHIGNEKITIGKLQLSEGEQAVFLNLSKLINR